MPATGRGPQQRPPSKLPSNDGRLRDGQLSMQRIMLATAVLAAYFASWSHPLERGPARHAAVDVAGVRDRGSAARSRGRIWRCDHRTHPDAGGAGSDDPGPHGGLEILGPAVTVARLRRAPRGLRAGVRCCTMRAAPRRREIETPAESAQHVRPHARRRRHRKRDSRRADPNR